MSVSKALACLALLPPLASATYPAEIEPPHYPLTHLVACDDKMGTAFRVGPTTMVSAAHVTSGENCKIYGRPFELIEQNGAKDYSILSVERKGGAIPVNCNGFIPGQWYFAVGYANGAQWQTSVPIFATIVVIGNGMRVLRREAIPGMSGGPILNSKGEAVGIVNARDIDPFSELTFSRELKDTPLCK